MNTYYKYGMMDGWHGDEHLTFGEEEDKCTMKTLESMTLYDLMGEDHVPWLTKNNSGFELQISNDEGVEIFEEKEIHPYAIESFVRFCRSFLQDYSSIENGV